MFAEFMQILRIILKFCVSVVEEGLQEDFYPIRETVSLKKCER